MPENQCESAKEKISSAPSSSSGNQSGKGHRRNKSEIYWNVVNHGVHTEVPIRNDRSDKNDVPSREKPVRGGRQKQVLEQDNQRLPMVELYDKYDQHQTLPPSTGYKDWIWRGRREWLCRSWNRPTMEWRTSSTQNFLKARDHDLATKTSKGRTGEEISQMVGWIYGLYHFTTRRWHIGQTITFMLERGRGHWYEPLRTEDLLHEALGNEISPFAYLIGPLEWMAPENYQSRSTRRMDMSSCFQWYATKRELYWVRKQKTIWPKGWNSQWPGQLATKEAARKARFLGLGDVQEAQIDPKEWLQ